MKKNKQPDGVVEVEWTSTKGLFMVKIQVEALDRRNLLSDVTRVLSDHGVNIISGTIATGSDRVATSQFSFEMADPQHLNSLLAAVRKIDGVFDVYRITGAKESAEPRLRKMKEAVTLLWLPLREGSQEHEKVLTGIPELRPDCWTWFIKGT